MPRARRQSADPAQLLTVHPVEGVFVAGVPHISQELPAEAAAALVATGAFSVEPIHEPGCNESCDAALGIHYLEGEPAPDTEAPAPDASAAGSEAPGEQPAPPDEAAPQPEATAVEAGASDPQE
jgi:hypothetical protein